MNYDEFAFFNQQLASMLREGVPLEGALLKLSAEMRDGALRREMEALAADLAKGVPLREALPARKLPDLYRRLLEVGVRSNDLPAVLTLLADYYQRRHVVWTRLKGLMVYPTIVLFCSFLLSVFFCCLVLRVFNNYADPLGLFVSGWRDTHSTSAALVGFWIPPVFLGLVIVALLVVVAVPALRRIWRWRLPAFKEASLAQVGGAMSLMLKSGVPLDQALGLLEQLESGSPAQEEIAGWRGKLAGGRGKFSDMAEGGKVFPPLFLWAAGHSGEDLGAGFQRASEIYQARASHRIEMLLYSALPCSIVALGFMLIMEIRPLVVMLISFMNSIGENNM